MLVRDSIRRGSTHLVPAGSLPTMTSVQSLIIRTVNSSEYRFVMSCRSFSWSAAEHVGDGVDDGVGVAVGVRVPATGEGAGSSLVLLPYRAEYHAAMTIKITTDAIAIAQNRRRLVRPVCCLLARSFSSRRRSPSFHVSVPGSALISADPSLVQNNRSASS